MQREQYWIDKNKSYQTRYGYNIMQYAGQPPQYEIIMKQMKRKEKLEFIQSEMELLEEEFIDKLEYNDRINYNITIGEREEVSAIQLNKIRKLYEGLLIYNKVITDNLLMEMEDNIIGNIELEGDLPAYIDKFPCFRVSCDFKNGDKGYYTASYDFLMKKVKDQGNSLKQTIYNDLKLWRLSSSYYIVDGYFVEKECSWEEHEKEEMIFMDW